MRSTSWGRISRGTRPPPCWRCWTRSRTGSLRDHYVDMPFDLSRGAVHHHGQRRATASPGRLYDRMDIIELGSYTQEEKLNIAMKHLVRKQLEKHGLSLQAAALYQGGGAGAHRGLHPGGRGAHPGADDRLGVPEGRQTGGLATRTLPALPCGPRIWRNFWGPGNSPGTSSPGRTPSAWSTAWPGPAWAGSCCPSRWP